MVRIMQTFAERSEVTGENAIEGLVRELDNDRPAERGRARATLVGIGGPAVPRLVGALRNRSERMRWEAAKTLGAIGDTSAGAALVDAMDDEMLEVRWAAEEGVIALGRDGLVSLLHGLITHSGSARFREAAHRILSALARSEYAGIAKPILEALEGPAPVAALPVAAFMALYRVKGTT